MASSLMSDESQFEAENEAIYSCLQPLYMQHTLEHSLSNKHLTGVTDESGYKLEHNPS